MKRTLFLSLALLFVGNVATVQTAQAIDTNHAIRAGILFAIAPAIYGIYKGAQKLGYHKTQTIAKGLATIGLGYASVKATITATEIHSNGYSEFYKNCFYEIPAVLCGFGAIFLGNSTIKDIKNWNKQS